MNARVAGLWLTVLCAACDCSRRDIDAKQYACTATAQCGAAAACIDGVCVLWDAGFADGRPMCDPFNAVSCGDPAWGCFLDLLQPGGVGVCFRPCDPIKQECGAGLKCSYASGEFRCFTDGTVHEGGTCTASAGGDDCVRGLVCVTGATAGMTCEPFCNGSSVRCPDGRACNGYLIEAGHAALFCRQAPCDALSQDCGGGDNCVPDLFGSTRCAPSGSAAPGDPCVDSRDCQRGSACWKRNGLLACRSACSLTGGSPVCQAPQSCFMLVDSTGFAPYAGACF